MAARVKTERKENRSGRQEVIERRSIMLRPSLDFQLGGLRWKLKLSLGGTVPMKSMDEWMMRRRRPESTAVKGWKVVPDTMTPVSHQTADWERGSSLTMEQTDISFYVCYC